MFFLCVGISHGECRGMGVLAIEGWNYYEVLARLCSCHSESVRRRATLHQSESWPWNIPSFVRQCSYIIPISIYGSMPINYHIPGGMNIHLPSGKLTLLLNMASYSELSHEKW